MSYLKHFVSDSNMFVMWGDLGLFQLLGTDSYYFQVNEWRGL